MVEKKTTEENVLNDEGFMKIGENQSQFRSDINEVLTKKGIKPGGFGQLPENYDEKLNEVECDNSDPYEVESSEDLVEIFGLFQKEISENCKNVYVPCCATNISPSLSFSKSRVIYVDKEEKSIKSLAKNGNEAYCDNAITFEMPDSEKADVVIIYNPQIDGYQLTKNLVDGGHVLCNDYHKTATEFFEKKDEFELIGIIRNTKSGMIFDKLNPSEYWEEVGTDEEWKKYKFSWDGNIETYQEGKSFVEKVLGKTSDNAISDYKMIRDNIEKYIHIIKEKDIGDNYGGETIYYEPKNLPKKKGNCDNTFVFKKK